MQTDEDNITEFCLAYVLHCFAYVPGETAPQKGPFRKGVNSPPSARGSVRYGARFHRFSYSSSNFSMATEMLG